MNRIYWIMNEPSLKHMLQANDKAKTNDILINYYSHFIHRI